MKEYFNRLVENQIKDTLSAMGAVLIQGPRAVGKSTTSRRLSKSSISIDESLHLTEIAKGNPEIILKGDTPRFIDEWQLAPPLWNAVRHEIDTRQETAQFILAGSASPTTDITRHTGAGRIGKVTMYPLSIFESNDSTQQVDFNELFHNKHLKVAGYGGLNMEQYTQKIVVGGWPGLIGKAEKQSQLYLSNYLDDISRIDMGSDILKTDPVRMHALIRAISRNISTEIPVTKLAKEAQLDTDSLSPQSARKYIDQLTQIFILQELPAWATHIRSNVRQRVNPKWHFSDPSLAAVALGISSEQLIKDPKTLGYFFESLAIRDLRVYAQALSGDVYHYRDETGLEVDAIIELRNGKWLACEIKLGGSGFIAEGIKNTIKLKNKLENSKLKDMVGLCVITAGKESYTDKETGVHIISLGHLYVDQEGMDL
jgi:predicted AAA+ superfamily ATPase